jgi:hypothetical protein
MVLELESLNSASVNMTYILKAKGEDAPDSSQSIVYLRTVLCCAVHTYSKRRASEMNQIKGV